MQGEIRHSRFFLILTALRVVLRVHTLLTPDPRLQIDLSCYGGAQTHYQILDVSPQASVQQIREAFRTKAKLYHPDRAPAGSEAQFHLVQAAYERPLHQ